jgi:hypothetical protein
MTGICSASTIAVPVLLITDVLEIFLVTHFPLSCVEFHSTMVWIFCHTLCKHRYDSSARDNFETMNLEDFG